MLSQKPEVLIVNSVLLQSLSSYVTYSLYKPGTHIRMSPADVALRCAPVDQKVCVVRDSRVKLKSCSGRRAYGVVSHDPPLYRPLIDLRIELEILKNEMPTFSPRQAWITIIFGFPEREESSFRKGFQSSSWE